MTLRFLGDYGFNLEELKKVITNTCNAFHEFNLIINGVEAFGKNNNIIWAGIKKNLDLIKMHGILESELESIGILKEDRKFSPHITLAREVSLTNTLNEYTFPDIETVVNKISLMESTRRNGVLIYSPLFTYNMK